MGSRPEGVPHPPTPEKPEGITENEWQWYLNTDPAKHPELRDKVEAALGWKKDDVAAAREIAEKVLGAVTITDAISEVRAKGHVPDDNLPRYRAIVRLARQVDSIANQASGLGDYAAANLFWAQAAKMREQANELRADKREEEQ